MWSWTSRYVANEETFLFLILIYSVVVLVGVTLVVMDSFLILNLFIGFVSAQVYHGYFCFHVCGF